MKKYFFNILTLVIVVATISSCVKKANEWDVEPNYARLFKTLVFNTSQISSTEVEIRYNQIVSAHKYIFEFSKDSLEFNEIVRTVEIFADTLTPFATSTTPSKVEYRTLFSELDGNSTYSVRMKGIDTISGLESSYSQFSFQTSAEQLFTNSEVFTDRIVMSWLPSDRVTHISVYDAISGEEIQNNVLSSTDKVQGSLELTNLNPGTNYRVVIYNETIERGVRILKTAGLQGGVSLVVNPGDDIPALLSAAIAEGKPNVILLFKGGETYNLSALTLPAGLSNISFTGESNASGDKPNININSLKLSDPIFGKVLIENVAITGAGGDFIDINTNGAEIEEYAFINSVITNYRAGIRLRNNSIKLKSIIIDDCIIHNLVSGYGLVNIGGSSPEVDLISIKNSTITDITTQLMDVRTKVKEIFVGNCTFYNENAGITQFFRFDTNNLPLALTIESNIISGTNSGGKINATSYDHGTSALPVTFAGSYRTNEMQIDRASRDFSGITIFPGAASELFVDPANRDFSIKPGANFSGR
ncbi:DUF5123 domain-containing protein, partial [Pseudoxanthomonas sp. SGD-10]